MGFLCLIPFFLIRFGLLSRLDHDAIKRAAYFPPLIGGEKVAYWFYQLSNGAIIVCILLSKVKYTPGWLFGLGLSVYMIGLLLLAVSVVNFSAPADNDFHQNGLYRWSRNPMYVSYFVVFMGCVLLTQSLALLVLVLIFQVAAHWIILSEERWCGQRFGDAYLQYMKKVRRYI